MAIKKKLIIPFILLLFLAPFSIHAAENGVGQLTDSLRFIGGATGLGQYEDNPDIYGKIAGFVNIALSFLGVLTVLFIIYGGFKWMTAAGNEETVRNAKRILRNAIIGLFIIFIAYALVSFLVVQLRALGIGSKTEFLP